MWDPNEELTVLVPVLDAAGGTAVARTLRSLGRGDVDGVRVLTLDVRDEVGTLEQRRAVALNRGLDEVSAGLVTVIEAGDFVTPGGPAQLRRAMLAAGTAIGAHRQVRVRGPIRVSDPEPVATPGLLHPAWRGLIGRGHRAERLWNQVWRREVVGDRRLDPTLASGSALVFGWQLHVAADSWARLGTFGYFRSMANEGHDLDPVAVAARLEVATALPALVQDHVQARALGREAVGTAQRIAARLLLDLHEAGRPATGAVVAVDRLLAAHPATWDRGLAETERRILQLARCSAAEMVG